jgi:hypothetical protein
MEVGIEDCLHIEVGYDAPSYPLDGVVSGSVSFLLVRIRLKHMELELRRRETAGGGAAARSEARCSIASRQAAALAHRPSLRCNFRRHPRSFQ